MLGLRRARDASVLERAGLVWLALGCIVLGLIPSQVLGTLRTLVRQLAHVDLPDPTAPWWLLQPLPGSSKIATGFEHVAQQMVGWQMSDAPGA